MSKNHFFNWLHPEKKTNAISSSHSYAYVHPCVINNKPHIVYPRNLEKKSPNLFAKLSQHYQKQGYALKEDQRSEKHTNKYKNERQKWTPILLFTASLLFESSAFAEVEVDINEDASFQQHQNIELLLISNAQIREEIKFNIAAVKGLEKQIKIKSVLAQSLFETLNTRYKKQASDPSYIVNDLKEIANYYSDFPDNRSIKK